MPCCIEHTPDPAIAHRDVELRGQRWHLLERGQGPLVLLLHGFPGRASGFKAQLRDWSQAGFRVVAPYLLGVPPSAQPREVARYETSELCQDLAELIVQLGHQSAHVVGHDWGAGLGWELAQSFETRVDSLVSLCVPSPRRMLAALLSPQQLARSWYIFFFQLPVLPERWLSVSGLDYFYAEYPPAERAQIVGEIRANGGIGRFVSYYRANVRAALFGRLAPRRPVRVPVLMVRAERDRFVGRELFEPELTWAPETELWSEPSGHHFLPQAMPDHVNPRIADFLRQAEDRKLQTRP